MSIRSLILSAGLLIAAVPALAQMPEPIPFAASDYPELRTELAVLEESERFSGVVLIARGEEVVFHEAFGLADRSSGQPIRKETAFNIASVGKQLTAAAILKLAEQDRLELDAPIGRWINDLPEGTGESVTVRHLLKMESGWADYMNAPAYRDDPGQFAEVDDYVQLIRTIKPAFAPGSDFAYSNISYELLGAIMEKVTGKTYAQALSDLILKPVGMTRSGCFPHKRSTDRAVPYAKVYAERIAAYPLMPQFCSPAGGLYSSTEDLLRFQRAVLDGDLISDTYARLLTNRFKDGAEAGPRLAFIGGTEGANAWVQTELANDLSVIVLSNYDPPSAEAVTLGILDWVKSQEIDR